MHPHMWLLVINAGSGAESVPLKAVGLSSLCFSSALDSSMLVTVGGCAWGLSEGRLGVL